MQRRRMYVMLFLFVSCSMWMAADVGASSSESDMSGLESGIQRSPKKYKLDYEKPEEFLVDFLNVNCHRDKPIKYWATQLLLFFSHTPSLKEFCRELARAVPSRDSMRIGSVFLMYQHCFSREIRNLIIKDLKKVWAALEVRCACNCDAAKKS